MSKSNHILHDETRLDEIFFTESTRPFIPYILAKILYVVNADERFVSGSSDILVIKIILVIVIVSFLIIILVII